MKESEKSLSENPTFNEGGAEELFDANLITNYENTIEYMEAIEGSGWLRDQPQGVNIKNSLKHVMDWLSGNKDNSESHKDTIVLYGFAGGDRYSVHKDGSVKFIIGFANERTESLARMLKFPITR